MASAFSASVARRKCENANESSPRSITKSSRLEIGHSPPSTVKTPLAMDILATAYTDPTFLTYFFLTLAIAMALGFEFVNGFHDTAKAVATVIYTHTLKPTPAVIWSDIWNLIGVLSSSGAVAFGIVALLPVELVLNVSSAAGFAMVFSLLVSAIVWNLGTWWLGLPASSSHTLIGSIIGVGLANALSGLAFDYPQDFRSESRTLQSSPTLDSGYPYAYLHWSELRPWLERWTKRNGPHRPNSRRRPPGSLCLENVR